MPKFGDVGREPSDDDGHFATFMYIGGDGERGIYLDDDDPSDKSMIGAIYPLTLHSPSWAIEWLSDE